MILDKFYYDYASIVYAESKYIGYVVKLNNLPGFTVWNN